METTNLAAALAKAQAMMGVAEKSGDNPFFKSNYSTFEDLVKCSREALTKNGLSISQYADSSEDWDYVVTRLMHSSGQEIVSKIKVRLPNPEDIQKFGSAMSYLKRYQLASICGIACGSEDDDGNSISQPAKPVPYSPQQKPTETKDKPSFAATHPATGEFKLLSQNQIDFLMRVLKGNKAKETEICNRLGANSVSNIPKDWFNSVLNELGMKPKDGSTPEPLPAIRTSQSEDVWVTGQKIINSMLDAKRSPQGSITEMPVEDIQYENEPPF